MQTKTTGHLEERVLATLLLSPKRSAHVLQAHCPHCLFSDARNRVLAVAFVSALSEGERLGFDALAHTLADGVGTSLQAAQQHVCRIAMHHRVRDLREAAQLLSLRTATRMEEARCN